MNYRQQYITIPEIDFSGFGSIVFSSPTLDYNNSNYNTLSIIFNVATIDICNTFAQNIIDKQNQINELLIYSFDYKTITSFNDCTVDKIDVSLSELSPSFYTIGEFVEDKSYTINIIFNYHIQYLLKSELMVRKKKIENIIKREND